VSGVKISKGRRPRRGVAWPGQQNRGEMASEMMSEDAGKKYGLPPDLGRDRPEGEKAYIFVFPGRRGVYGFRGVLGGLEGSCSG